MSDLNSNSKSLLEFLGPKKSFGFGFITAIIVMIIVALIMQLGSGNSWFLGKQKVTTYGTPSAETDTADTDTGIKLAAITSADHIRGDLNKAQAVIVEFSDFDCPFCHNFDTTLNSVLQQYGDKVALVYRHFPLDSLHPEARAKAEASECAAELGGNDAFWAFVDIMFDTSRSIKEADLSDVAKEIGLSVTDFNKCVSENRYADKVNSQYQDAIASGGLGTPHSIIVSRDGSQTPLSGAVPLSQVTAALDAVLQ